RPLLSISAGGSGAGENRNRGRRHVPEEPAICLFRHRPDRGGDYAWRSVHGNDRADGSVGLVVRDGNLPGGMEGAASGGGGMMKKGDGTLQDDILELLKHTPIWVGPALAATVFVFFRFFVPVLFS